jgi:hypothetical protein
LARDADCHQDNYRRNVGVRGRRRAGFPRHLHPFEREPAWRAGIS